MDMTWVVLTIAVTAVAWIVIRRQLKKKEAAPPKEAASEETPTEEEKEEDFNLARLQKEKKQATEDAQLLANRIALLK